MNGISGVDHADGRMKRGLGPALDANYVERCPERMDFLYSLKRTRRPSRGR
jgi:hypothetical protein